MWSMLPHSCHIHHAHGHAHTHVTNNVTLHLLLEQVGGLEHYVTALKEMVFLPLVYPELFERFKVQPPRGVLFYGPPGTGVGNSVDTGVVFLASPLL